MIMTNQYNQSNQTSLQTRDLFAKQHLKVDSRSESGHKPYAAPRRMSGTSNYNMIKCNVRFAVCNVMHRVYALRSVCITL